MLASSRTFTVGWVLAVLGLALACGGSSKSVDGDSSGGTGGSTGGTSAAGGSGAKGGTSGSGGTTSTSGSGGTGDPVSVMIGNCPAFTPCGGDAVGTWKLSSVCSDGSSVTGGVPLDLPACATDNAKQSSSSNIVFDFKADGTYTAVGSTTVAVGFSFDDACAMTTFPGADAATLCTLFTTLAGQQASAGGQVSCALENGVCDCSFGAPPADTNESGTYMVNGDQVTLDYSDTAADGTVTMNSETDPFCVEGSSLTFQSSGMAGGGIFTLERN